LIVFFNQRNTDRLKFWRYLTLLKKVKQQEILKEMRVRGGFAAPDPHPTKKKYLSHRTHLAGR
jgi:hypothetical protein